MRGSWLVVALGVVMGQAMAAEVTVLTADRIRTSDPQQPLAQAMAWDAQGKLLQVGSRDQVLAAHPGARRIDAAGKTVIPGLIDAHGHLMGLGFSLITADLTGTTSKDDVLKRLRDYAQSLPAGAWVQGSGWDQNDWPEKQFPTAADLDAVFPDRPVWLERIDGHAGWANSAALRAVVAHTGKSLDGDWQPDGGRIERRNGKATGVFVDGAMSLVYAVVPPADAATREKAAAKAFDAAVSHGLTGVHDMGVSREDLALFKQFADAGKLPLRIDAYANGDGDALSDLCRNGLYQHAGGRLEMRGVKLYIDGALGSRGAAMLSEYSDDHGNLGLLVTDPVAYAAAVRKAHDCGVQVATHAIGDRGNRIVLDTYQKVLGDTAGSSDHRWRVEHAQIVDLHDIARFAPMGVVASMQPTHATSDMPWAEDRVGPERILGAYAWQRFVKSGAHIALGSDFPVESVDPRLGLYAAVTRQDRAGQPPGGWQPDQRLSIAQALQGFTADAAWAGRDDDRVGQLKAGLRADFVVLDEDPVTVPAAELDDLHVRSTWVDGAPVFEAK